MDQTTLPRTTVSAGEAAELLHVDRATISRWIADGTLKGCGWDGRERTIPVDQIERLARLKENAGQAVTIAKGSAMALNRWWRARYGAAVAELVTAARALVACADSGEAETPPDQSAKWAARVNDVVSAVRKAEQAAGVAHAAIEIAGEAVQLERSLERTQSS